MGRCRCSWNAPSAPVVFAKFDSGRCDHADPGPRRVEKRVRRDASRCSHVPDNRCKEHLESSPSGVREEVALRCARYDRDLQDAQVLVGRAD